MEVAYQEHNKGLDHKQSIHTTRLYRLFFVTFTNPNGPYYTSYLGLCSPDITAVIENLLHNDDWDEKQKRIKLADEYA